MSTKKYAYVNSEMLVWARSTTPFVSTHDVQDRINIAYNKVDDWEKGKDYPSITEAKKLANLYKVPFAAFFLSTPPSIDPRPYTDRRTKRNALYGPISYELWSEIGRVIGNRDRLIDLVDEEELELYEAIPVVKDNATVEEISLAIRNFLGITLPFKNKTAYGANSYKYYRKVFENKGILVCQITGVSVDEMKGISISYDSYPIIAVNNKDYERAKAFSLFHELAHLVRRSSSLCLIDFDERNDAEEKKCDAIAAEVMMPKAAFISLASEALNRYNSYSEDCLNYIADRFGVSVFSVIRRLHNIKLIDDEVYSSMYDEYSRKFEENQAEIDINNENRENHIPYHFRFLNKEGYLYTRTIMNSYSKGYISLGELCNTLGIKRSHIDNMERAVMSI